VSFQRSFDGSEPLRHELAGTREIRKAHRSSVVATGTLACPACDAPVAPPRPLAPADALACPFCDHAGRVREFLSLQAPSRPAWVLVRVRSRRRA